MFPGRDIRVTIRPPGLGHCSYVEAILYSGNEGWVRITGTFSMASKKKAFPRTKTASDCRLFPATGKLAEKTRRAGLLQVNFNNPSEPKRQLLEVHTDLSDAGCGRTSGESIGAMPAVMTGGTIHLNAAGRALFDRAPENTVFLIAKGADVQVQKLSTLLADAIKELGIAHALRESREELRR